MRKAAKRHSSPPVGRSLMEDGPESLDYGSVSVTDIVYEALAALQDLGAVIDGAGPSGLLAVAMLNSYGIRATVVKQRECEPVIGNLRANFYDLIPRGLVIVHKNQKLFTALLQGTVTSNGYSLRIIFLKAPAEIGTLSYCLESVSP